MSRRGPPPLNLIVSALIAVLTLVLVLLSPESVLWFSVPLGLVMIFLLPGYLLTFALFFGRVDLNLRGKVVLNIVLAIVLAAVVSLVLTFTPRGLQTASLATILSLLALFLTAIAYLRWSALPRRKRSASFGSRSSIRSARLLSTKVGRANRSPFLLFFGVAAVLVVVGVALTINSHQRPTIDGEKGYTEFHVSWPDGSAGGEEGGEVTAMASIVNREHRQIRYTLQLVLNHSILFGKEITLGHNQSWEGPVNFNPDAQGSQRLDFLLFKDGNLASPYLEDHLWANAATKNPVENLSEKASEGLAGSSLANGSSMEEVQKNESNASDQGSKVVVLGVSKESSGFVSSASSGGGGSSRKSRVDNPVRGGSGGAEVHEVEETPPKEENTGIPEVESHKEEQSVNTSFPQNESENTTSPDSAGAIPAEVNASLNVSETAGNATNDIVEVLRESNLSEGIEANPLAENLSTNSPPVLTDLLASSPSPQMKGVNLVWTANATDPDGDEIVYKFLLNERATTDWSSSNSWTWNTSSEVPGVYRIRAIVRDERHAGADGFDSAKEANFTLLGPNRSPVLQELRAEPPSPNTAGTSILWRANATDPDGDEILYKFLLNEKAVMDWSASSSWEWNTSQEAPGDFRVRVLLRDGHHAPKEGFDGFKDAAFTLLPSNRIPVREDLGANPASPQAPGSSITWTANATDPDEDQLLYRFILNNRPVTVWSKFNTWRWETSGSEPGDYRIGVQIRDSHHAAEESFDAFKEVTFTLSSANRIPSLQTLSPDKSSSQVAGTGINWTAQATDPDGDEVFYKFLMNNQEMTDWITNGKWSWNTSALAPEEYRIVVLARDNKHAQASGFDSSMEARFTLSPTNRAPLLLDLKPDLSSPQVAGESIHWIANATDPDGDGIVFRFLQNDRAVTDWSESSSREWNTSGASPGNYTIKVQARDGKHSGPDGFDSSLAAEFTLLEPNQPPALSSLNPDMQGPQVQGAIVFWKASGTDPDGDKILYRFLLNGKPVSRWSESDNWAWATAGQPAGEHRIKVLARDGHHATEGSYDAFLEKTFTISSPNQVPALQDLLSDLSSPQTAGAKVVWTAKATDPDGDKVDYKFLLNDREMTDWSGSNLWTWNTSSATPGEYRVKVQAKDGNHASDGSYDSIMERTFTISSPNQNPALKDLVPDMSSPQPVNARITWTAWAADPDGDKVVYRFLLNGKAATDWSEPGSWTWDTAQLSAGDYVIGVQVRDKKHSGPDSYDGSLQKTFTLLASNQPPIVNSLEPDKPSPQAQGTSVLWKVSATDPDGDKILYRFLLNGQPATRWSESDIWNWSSKGLPAVSYRIGVQVRDGHHAPEASFDGSKETSFTLNSEIDQEIDRLLASRPGAAGQGQRAQASQAAQSSSSAPVVLGMVGNASGKDEKAAPRNLG